MARVSYAARINYCQNPLAKCLLQLMDQKKTNLCLSADVTQAQQLIQLADHLGPLLCVLKTHIDIIRDFSPALIQELTYLANKHEFILFEDRKFADIGHTVKEQYAGGVYQIADWAHIVNAHTLPGPGIISGIQAGANHKERALLLLAEMSSKGHLFDERYKAETLKMAKSFPEFVIGFITQRALDESHQWLNFTPGIQFESKGDQLGQQYITPEIAIGEQGSDIIIVGRGIIQHEHPLKIANEYRERAWQAYLSAIPHDH